MASTTEKLRRGVPISGASPNRDLATGGASYNFTRLEKWGDARRRRGIVFKPSVLKRMDAITYDYDYYGRTLSDEGANFVLQQRLTSWKGMASVTVKENNETIFKNSLSIFEDVDYINVMTESQKEELIQVFTEAGYKKWPDGRELDEVIIVEARSG